jgi:hypothetical protein
VPNQRLVEDIKWRAVRCQFADAIIRKAQRVWSRRIPHHAWDYGREWPDVRNRPGNKKQTPEPRWPGVLFFRFSPGRPEFMTNPVSVVTGC